MASFLTTSLALLLIVAIPCALLWLLVRFAKVVVRGFRSTSTKTSDVIRFPPPAQRTSAKIEYVLKSEPVKGLVDMPDETSRLFTYKDERQAAKARQRLWMRYEDRQGHVTERTVEIYRPEDDEVIFAWCCLARAPRTFARRSILSWRLMPDTFVFDPIIDQYWEEEGTRDLSEKVPWRRWLEDQPNEIADRYESP